MLRKCSPGKLVRKKERCGGTLSKAMSELETASACSHRALEHGLRSCVGTPGSKEAGLWYPHVRLTLAEVPLEVGVISRREGSHWPKAMIGIRNSCEPLAAYWGVGVGAWIRKSRLGYSVHLEFILDGPQVLPFPGLPFSSFLPLSQPYKILIPTNRDHDWCC